MTDTPQSQIEVPGPPLLRKRSHLIVAGLLLVAVIVSKVIPMDFYCSSILHQKNSGESNTSKVQLLELHFWTPIDSSR